MSQTDWLEVKNLFLKAIQLPENDRTTFVENCDQDVDTRKELIRMIEIHAESTNFLESPLVTSPGHHESEFASPIEMNSREATAQYFIGKVIDGYKIQKPIGEGGMGLVFAASQSNPERIVALKLLKVFNSQNQSDPMRRFQQEATVLARLNHPNIAHVHSAGVQRMSKGEQPWFAMELIDGLPLDKFCSNQTLSTAEKLNLLLQIIDAVDYAHEQGVIHRDLKPSNILIENRTPSSHTASSDEYRPPKKYTPKIVDFGVAKFVDTEINTHTQSGDIVGTLNYMSPEQFVSSSDKLTRQCDVYALGVIGFELLSGELPHDRPSQSLFEIVTNVPHATPKRLGEANSQLGGDLEIVFSKALATDSSQRYQTARCFADDIRACRENKPVRARRPTLFYRTRKFVRRNRTLLTASVITILALTAGLLMYASEAKNARLAAAASAYEAEKATAINNFITNDFMIKFIGASNSNRTKSKADLVRDASSNIESMFGDRPNIEAAVRNEIGTIYYNLGALDEAKDQFALARQLWQSELGENHPDTLKAVNNLGQTYQRLGDGDNAERLYRKAVEGRKKELGEFDTHTIASMNNLAELLRGRDNKTEAETLFRSAIRAHKTSGRVADRSVLTAMANLGSLLIETDRLDEAIDLHHDVYHQSNQIYGESNVFAMYAGSRYAQTLYRNGDLDSAEKVLVPVLKRFDEMFGIHHSNSIIPRRLLAKIYAAQERHAAARNELTKAQSALKSHNPNERLLRKIRRQIRQVDQSAAKKLQNGADNSPSLNH